MSEASGSTLRASIFFIRRDCRRDDGLSPVRFPCAQLWL